MNEILRNFPWNDKYSDESFVGKFHENNYWDDVEYFKLENALYKLCSEYKESNEIPREVAWPIMRIFSYLMLSLGCQYDSNDGFEIKSITRDQFQERRERLQLVFEGFFKGEMPNKEYLGY